MTFHLRRALAWDLGNLTVTPAEQARLAAHGITDETAQRYLAWRRSVLLLLSLPAILTTGLYQVAALDNDFDIFTSFGWVVFSVAMTSLYVMPAAAIAAFLSWHRPGRSRAIMRYGWIISFTVPILTTLIPVEWVIRIDSVGTGEHATNFEKALRVLLDLFGAEPGAQGQRQVARMIIGIEYFLNAVLMVAIVILTLIPGTLRAGLRIKALLPAQTVTGWFLVVAPLFSSLLLLPVFIAVNQIASDPLLIVGTMLLMGAPWMYVAFSGVFVRPLSSPADCRWIGRVQGLAMLALGLAWILLAIYATTRRIPMVDKTLIGLHDTTSLVRPWDWYIVRSLIEYTSRSLSTTIVVADLLLLMGLSVWETTKQSVWSGEAKAVREAIASRR